jgi:hypothetical protein
MREDAMAPTDDSWQLEQSWPGLVADRDTVRYDPGAFDTVVRALQAKLSEVSGSTPGSYPDVKQQYYLLNAFAEHLEKAKNWDGGKSFAAALRQSHEELTNVYNEINGKLAIAVFLIEQSAQSYKHVNAANES